MHLLVAVEPQALEYGSEYLCLGGGYDPITKGIVFSSQQRQPETAREEYNAEKTLPVNAGIMGPGASRGKNWRSIKDLEGQTHTSAAPGLVPSVRAE